MFQLILRMTWCDIIISLYKWPNRNVGFIEFQYSILWSCRLIEMSENIGVHNNINILIIRINNTEWGGTPES